VIFQEELSLIIDSLHDLLFLRVALQLRECYRARANLRQSIQHVCDLFTLKQGKEMPLDTILNLSQHAKATDSREKIYGVLQLLLAALTSLIEPDYAMTT
jgi:hypothetical protein